MDVIIIPILLLIKSVLGIVSTIIIADVLLNWLIALNILSTSNHIIMIIISSISRFSNFMLDPIRRRLPLTLGNFDISPIILILLLTFFDNVISRVLIKMY